jgi:hypothetical protein
MIKNLKLHQPETVDQALIAKTKVATARDLDRVQRNVSDFTRQVAEKEIVDGRHIADVVLASGNNTITHKLGRKPVGWLVARKTAAADIYEVSADADRLVLNASAGVTITLWIY